MLKLVSERGKQVIDMVIKDEEDGFANNSKRGMREELDKGRARVGL